MVFITLPHKNSLYNTGDDLHKFMKVIVIYNFQKNCSKGMKLFYMIYLPGDLSTIQAIDKILDPSNIPLALFSILEGKKYRNLSKDCFG